MSIRPTNHCIGLVLVSFEIDLYTQKYTWNQINMCVWNVSILAALRGRMRTKQLDTCGKLWQTSRCREVAEWVFKSLFSIFSVVFEPNSNLSSLQRDVCYKIIKTSGEPMTNSEIWLCKNWTNEWNTMKSSSSTPGSVSLDQLMVKVGPTPLTTAAD